jgi:hypothetical protein
VVDNGTPALSDQTVFHVSVGETNRPPVLSTIVDRVVDEMTSLTFIATAGDPDQPPNTLTFSLDAGAPAGAKVDPVTGRFDWTPTEAQGPGSYTVWLRVTDNGLPQLSDVETFGIVDQQGWSNLVDVMNPQANVSSMVPQTFSFHPDTVRSIGTGPLEMVRGIAEPLSSASSFVAYNAFVDQRAFVTSGTGYRRGLAVFHDDSIQFALFRAAIQSRNINNQFATSVDPAAYNFTSFNCGSWVQYILAGSEVPFPFPFVNMCVGRNLQLNTIQPQSSNYALNNYVNEYISLLTFSASFGGH